LRAANKQGEASVRAPHMPTTYLPFEILPSPAASHVIRISCGRVRHTAASILILFFFVENACLAFFFINSCLALVNDYGFRGCAPTRLYFSQQVVMSWQSRYINVSTRMSDWKKWEQKYCALYWEKCAGISYSSNVIEKINLTGIKSFVC
jgi:hypothetical protein